jgi:hypothetical protein
LKNDATMTSYLRNQVAVGRALADEGRTAQRLVSTRIFLAAGGASFLHRTGGRKEPTVVGVIWPALTPLRLPKLSLLG